jgi:hypothetical protein
MCLDILPVLFYDEWFIVGKKTLGQIFLCAKASRHKRVEGKWR